MDIENSIRIHLFMRMDNIHEIISTFEDGLPYLETHLDVEGTEDEGGKESVVRSKQCKRVKENYMVQSSSCLEIRMFVFTGT